MPWLRKKARLPRKKLSPRRKLVAEGKLAKGEDRLGGVELKLAEAASLNLA